MYVLSRLVVSSLFFVVTRDGCVGFGYWFIGYVIVLLIVVWGLMIGWCGVDLLIVCVGLVVVGCFVVVLLFCCWLLVGLVVC